MKNKEPLILAVVVFFSLVTYYLVEPFAHHVLHKVVVEAPSEGFAYTDLPAITKTGNATAGKDLVVNAGCTGCHSMEVAGMPAPMDAVMAAQSYGVNPPDLSNAGSIYDAKFLADLIKNPAHALNVEHKFDADKGQMHPMVAFYGMGGDIDQEIADMVAYLQSIAKTDLSPAAVYENACGRCHAVGYEKWTQIGTKPTFKKKQDELAFDAKVLDYQDSLKAYMGKLPPDLSMYIRSRGDDFLSKLVENPQNILAGTAMPRVGVTQESMEKVLEHMKNAGDTKRHERAEIGTNVMIYIVIFAIFALLWKKQVWKDLH
ncbi:MAG: cytochrome C [Sulfurimonas sp.]|nr:MAG: cytochrome C [Sulfurimonas sp.]